MTIRAVDFAAPQALALLDAAGDLVQVVNADGAFLYVNVAWMQRLGYSGEDAHGMTFLDVIHRDHQQAWKAIFRAVLDGRRLDHFEMVLTASDGTGVPVEGSVFALRGADGATYVCAMLRDSAARTIGEQRVSQLLYRDEQTGLFNRNGFLVRGTRLLEVVEENRDRVGAWLVYVAIDDLDAIARKHGATAGSDSLVRVAELLRRTFRVHDVVARLSRDAFAALVSLPPRYPPNYIAARLRGALALANRQAGKPWDVAVAIGQVKVEPGQDLDDAIDAAALDANFHAAKVAV